MPSSTKDEAVIATERNRLNDLSTEEVLSRGDRDAPNVIWFIGMTVILEHHSSSARVGMLERGG